MLRPLVKTGIARALHWTGVDQCIGILNGSRDMPLVVVYHRVVEDFTASAEGYVPAMLISRQMLDRQLDWIGRRFRFVSLDELGSRLECGEPFDSPAAAVTFDDGYQEVYENAFPLLKRKGIPAGIFVVTDLVGTGQLQTYDRLYPLLARAYSRWSSPPHQLASLLLSLDVHLPMPSSVRHVLRDPLTAMQILLTAFPQDTLHRVVDALESEVALEEASLNGLHPLSWEMVSEMHRAGMTIGSHTRSHALLNNEDWRTVLDETAGSRLELEKRLGIPIQHFAYPNGSYNAATIRAVAEVGYRFAYTTCRHRNPRYPFLTIPRRLLWENSSVDAWERFSSSIMSCQAHGVFDFATRCQHNHRWPAYSSLDAEVGMEPSAAPRATR